ncbi:hypothetical protein ACFLZV_06270 [Candidatus Margulisiibacteriota bacterium]
MLNKRTVIIFCAILIPLLLTIGCTKAEEEALSNYITAVVDHFGFDFSEGIATANNSDGETIDWLPGGGTHPSYSNWVGNLWWRNTSLDQVNYKNQTKDYGQVSLASVTSAPSEWDVTPNPLIPGHIFAAKCADGFVLMEVLAVGTANIPEAADKIWPAKVKYIFTTSSTFTH